MDPDVCVKLAVYHHFAERASRPSPGDVAARLGACETDVLAAYTRLRAKRVLVLEADGATIRMAPPFSGIPTQHVVEVGGVSYFANCAWDAFGIPAALGKTGTVHSRCAQSGQPFRLEIDGDGPSPSDWLFHCAIPAARWWDDIVFT
jgi:hypothetical protein